jgi:hypothetical protein
MTVYRFFRFIKFKREIGLFQLLDFDEKIKKNNKKIKIILLFQDLLLLIHSLFFSQIIAWNSNNK